MAFHMYVSLQGDDQIARFLMNPETGSLEPQGAVEVAGGPAPLAIDPPVRCFTPDSGATIACRALGSVSRPES